ncbi:unnamed protein product [Arctogadus glacialis]
MGMTMHRQISAGPWAPENLHRGRGSRHEKPSGSPVPPNRWARAWAGPRPSVMELCATGGAVSGLVPTLEYSLKGTASSSSTTLRCLQKDPSPIPEPRLKT